LNFFWLLGELTEVSNGAITKKVMFSFFGKSNHTTKLFFCQDEKTCATLQQSSDLFSKKLLSF